MTETEEIVINPADYAVRLTTTLNRLKEHNACVDRYRHLLKALGGTSVDPDAPINLLMILEHNGTEDCLWALCASAENCDQVARLMVADFAEAVVPIYEKHYPNDDRPRKSIVATRMYAIGKIGASAWASAWDAAWAAAWAAAGTAAWAAAWTAARAAARNAACTVARDAAWAAAWAAARAATWADAGTAARAAAWDAAWDAQAEIIKRYLLP